MPGLQRTGSLHVRPVGTASGSCRSSGQFGQQLGDARARLGAVALPVLHTLEVDAQLFFLAACQRVVETNALDEFARMGTTVIGHRYVVIRVFLAATACKSDRYHDFATVLNNWNVVLLAKRNFPPRFTGAEKRAPF